MRTLFFLLYLGTASAQIGLEPSVMNFDKVVISYNQKSDTLALEGIIVWDGRHFIVNMEGRNQEIIKPEDVKADYTQRPDFHATYRSITIFRDETTEKYLAKYR